ncbi:MAG: C25 family cysteine peptidase [Bacteroidia bacterium]
MRIFRILLCLFVAFSMTTVWGQYAKSYTQVLSSTANETVVRVIPQGFEQISVNEGHKIKLTHGTSLLEAGSPDVQKLAFSLLIPDQANMKMEVLSANYSDIANVNLLPSKGNLSRTINPDEVPYKYGEAYQQDEFFPKNLAELRTPYILRDVRGQAVWVYATRYNPVTKVLRVYKDITLKISSAGVGGENVLYRNQALQSIETEFAKIYQHQFINAEKLLQYTPLNEEGELLVISDPTFMTAIQPLLDWKKQKGIRTTLVDVTTIGTTPAVIKAYIQNYYNTHNLKYVMFVGDHAQIPVGTAGGNPSDTQYGYLQGTDAYPEIFMGRISAETITHVNTQVTRTLEYEKVLAANPVGYDKAICIGSDEGPGDDNEYDWQHARNIRTQLLAFTYTDVGELYDGSQGGNDAAGNPTAANVVTWVDAGVSLINYTGHGSASSIVTCNFTNASVAQLKNVHKYPYIWTVGCVTGEFMNTTCFAEAWARATDAATGVPTGSVVNFMSTINQSWDPPMEAQDEFNAILTENVAGNIRRTFGGISYNGCMKMNDTYGSQGDEMTDTWTIFGDPTLLMFTTQPTAMTITHAPSLVLGSSSFIVNGSVNDALVCLMQNGEILATSKVVSGVANFTFPPLSSVNPITITATAFNHLPYQQDIQITVPTGPYVIVPLMTLNDAAGNNNQKADYSETVKLNVDLQNVGIQNANATQVNLSTSSTYLTLNDAAESTGTINANTSGTFNDAFEVTVANNVPDQTVANFTLVVNDNAGNSWTTPASLLLNAPVLKVNQWIISDATGGNNNGFIDPGEVITIAIKNGNVGHADAMNCVATLSITTPGVNIQNQNVNLGNVNVNGNTDAVFTVQVGNGVPKNTVLDFSYQVNAGSYQAQSSHIEFVMPDVLTFEPNSPTTVNFVQTGANPWFTSNTIYYQGNNSYQSGDVSANQMTSMEMAWNVTQNDSIRFHLKTSSEQDYDYLYFYMNGQEVGKWSGETNWTRVAFATPVGMYNFKWTYGKDAFVSDGADAAWVDDIFLPPGTLSIVAIEPNETAATWCKVYPNPAQNSLHLAFDQNLHERASVQLYNVNGQLIQTQSQAETASSLTLNLENVSNGMYFLHIQVGNQSLTKKIVVEK